MNLPHSFERPEGAAEFGAAIRFGERARVERDAMRWGLILVIFMRLLAALWMVQGLSQWIRVLTSASSLFDSLPAAEAAAVIFFGILDLLASVGLWLATPWGGVLWLFAVLSQIFVAMALRHFFAAGQWIVIADFILILLYFVLTWKAGHSGGQSSRN